LQASFSILLAERDLDLSTNIVKDSTQPVVTIQPITQPFELGPIIDLFPYVQADQKTVSLTARAQIREFEGYENLSWMQAVVRQGGETRKQLAPLPKFRLREVSASAVVRDGHTLILAGGTIEEERVERGHPEVAADVDHVEREAGPGDALGPLPGRGRQRLPLALHHRVRRILGVTEGGQILNVNADTMAAASSRRKSSNSGRVRSGRSRHCA